MENQRRKAFVALPIVLVIAIVLAVAGSQGSAEVSGIPLFALCIGLAFLIQWVAFIPAFINQTETFYDLTGSFTYITLVAVAMLLTPETDARSVLLLGLVVVWAVRLGSFLFGRIRRAG